MPDEFDLFTPLQLGERLRDEALDAHETRRVQVIRLCREHLAAKGHRGEKVTADDARDFLATLPDGDELAGQRKDWMGAIFRPSQWLCVGWSKSRHPDNHARMIRVWQWKGNP